MSQQSQHSVESVVSDAGSLLPLTAAQQPIWLGHEFDQASPAYNVASYIEILGAIDHSLLEISLNKAVMEVEALRLRFVNVQGDDIPKQIVDDEISIKLNTLDKSSHKDPVTAAHSWMQDDLAKRIDLLSGSPFATSLFQIERGRYWWYFKTHHIILDGFGLSMLFRRVAEIYSSLTAGKALSANPFGSIESLVESDAAYIDSETYSADRTFWKEVCKTSIDVPSFVNDVALPSKSSIQHRIKINAELSKKIKVLADSVSEHWIPVVISAFATYLSRFTSKQDIVLGVPFLNRLGTNAARVPCTMANVLPLHATIKPGSSVEEIIRKVSLQLTVLRRHQRYRAEHIRRDCGLVGEGRRLTGPQINIDLFTDKLSFAGASGIANVLSAGPADDISFTVHSDTKGNDMSIIGFANPALYTQDTLITHLTNFLGFLSDFTERSDKPVGNLDAFSKDELAFFFDQNNITSAHAISSSDTLVSLFEAQVVRFPDVIALTFNRENLTYSTLNTRVNMLAHELLAYNLGSNKLVAMLLPRSIDMIVAILASLKAGLAYVPIDPEAPLSRLETVLADATPGVVISDLKTMHRINGGQYQILVIDDADVKVRIAAQPSRNLSIELAKKPTPTSLAYVIYTSGSTGNPKGVKITHHNVVRLFQSTDTWFEYRNTDVWALCHSYIFDASVWEMWGALLHGGRLVIVPAETTRVPEQLLELIVNEGVTIFGQIPSAFYNFMEAEQDRPDLAAKLKLRYQCFGGEALDLPRLKPWFERHKGDAPRLLNLYGITETTVNATYHFVTESEVLENSGSLIGKPFDDLNIMILDDALRPVPVGHYGEMYLVGHGLAEGYLNRPDLDASRFVANPYGPIGSRMYRSGDVAVRHINGDLEYLGRADQQVKVRGYRIELGEIESQLRSHPAISDAVASVRVDALGDPKLIAHVVLHNDNGVFHTTDINSIRDYLLERLPVYMVPSAIGILDELPFNQNGKVNRKALPDIALTLERHIEPARDEIDERVLQVWSEQLQIAELSLDDNFFDIGGDSIKAIRVCRDLDFPVLILFENSTPRACADFIRANKSNPTLESSNLLHRFRPHIGKKKINIVCIPFAGGNAFSYRPLSENLPESFSCWCVNLPGHDPLRPLANMMTIQDVAEKAVQEIISNIEGPIIIYGHCAGNAIAIEIARKLEQENAHIIALTIGGMLLDSDPNAVLENVAMQTGENIIAFLRNIGGFQDVVDEESLSAISRMTKHDSMETAQFFAAESKNLKRLNIPIHVVIGNEDPLTTEYDARYLDWKSYSSNVSLSVIDNGGHYFVTDKAPQLAKIISSEYEKFAVAITKNTGRRALRNFSNPFDDADADFLLISNSHDQYSLWPAFVKTPKGWNVESDIKSRDESIQVLLAIVSGDSNFERRSKRS